MLRAAFGLVILVMNSGFAAEPVKTNLFTAGTNGYTIYRIPGIIVTPKGSLLVYCEARKDRSDWAAIDPLVRRSTDGGKTWEPAQRLPLPDVKFTKNPAALARKSGKEGETTVNNIVMIPDVQTGAVHGLYCIEYQRCFYIRSDDDGQTWTPPREITSACDELRPMYNWKVMATGPGHGIQLRSGRLIVPVWLARGTEGNGHKPSCISTISSDDSGKTWHAGAIIANETDPLLNPSETVIAELADGRVMVNIRSENKKRRAVAISPNGATQWSRPRFDETLVEPVCMAALCRLSRKPTSDRNRLVFANPNSATARKNLTIRLSYDEGETWAVSRVLEPGASAYSDLAVGPDGTIYCVYERGKPNQKNTDAYQLLTIAKLDLNWLTAGQDQLPGK
ncbi:MAG: glycoside hydrolase [Bacteroidales bacterium]|nr:glycoside hydrolase [Bacteroidales bacterium]